jgi:tetratricopeptide (TPR) repeat protein
MFARWNVLPLALLSFVTFGFSQQPSASQASAKIDYSQEAAVIEDMTTNIAFENSGTSTREQVSRVRIQTDAGVKDWGVLSFPYESATQTVEVDYVRVHKPDGSAIVSPADNIQDLDSEITQAAPFYSDLREKHVAVKGLGKGDTLEYAAHWHTTKPLVAGQFWLEYTFHHQGIVLSETLKVRVPSERAVKVKGPTTQTVSSDNTGRVYTWTYSKLKNINDSAEQEKKSAEASRGRSAAPDVQLSSFSSWEEVGRWYWGLQRDRVEPSAAVRAKAAELTKGLNDDDAKLRAIYSFVSMQYRYIGIAFGVGRYQPHAADDVLTNNYGDCKDKHTLFASLLQASGITIFPALISGGHILDEDVPSPGQFDHIIGYLPHGKDALWLDTTPEVAPFSLLLPNLRDKKALVISNEGTATLRTTPLDPPVTNWQKFSIDGKLKDDGSFEGKVEDTIHGENEVYLRAAFRTVPQAQWKDLVQQISYQLGYSGVVSDVSAGTPEDMAIPVHFAYSYNRKDYPDWANHRFTIPGLPFIMPPVRDDSEFPVWLGSAYETVSQSRVGLPLGYKPELPHNVDLSYDFAEYHSSYSQEAGVLSATRRLVIKQHEVSTSEFEQYRKFLKQMSEDVDQYVPAFPVSGLVSSGRSADAQNRVVLDPRVTKFQDRLRSLPNSSSAEANKLEANAREQTLRHDLPGAVASLYRAVEEDAKFARAWVLLGTLLLSQKQTDAGVAAFKKAISAAPDEPAIPKALGYALMANSNWDAAVPVWQDFLTAHPDDADGPANLGNCLRKFGRNADAIKAYEQALKIKPDQVSVQMSIASIYLQAGERQKASAAFQKVAQMDSEKKYLNDVAYEMANDDLDLQVALDYAKQAVRAAEEDSETITLPELKVEDLRKIFQLAAYWDTLGWINERLSNMEPAERYLKASWRLDQDGVVAGHLCHLYRREHKTAAAIQMCRLAISRMSVSQQVAFGGYNTELAAAQENLRFLTGRSTNSANSFDESGKAIAERTFKLPRFLPGTESGEFFLLFASDGKSRTFAVEDVRFITGSDSIKRLAKQLKNVAFNIPAPADTKTRFVWRGILGCYKYTGCSFVVLDPASVDSLD